MTFTREMKMPLFSGVFLSESFKLTFSLPHMSNTPVYRTSYNAYRGDVAPVLRLNTVNPDYLSLRRLCAKILIAHTKHRGLSAFWA